MRVLAWPIYSYPGNVLADSGYICFRNLVRAIPEWEWEIVVPEWADGRKYPAPVDDLDGLPNVTKVPVPMHTLFRMQETQLDEATVRRYSPQVGHAPLDLVVCGSNQIAMALANAWSVRVPDDDRPLVVAWDLLTRDDRGRGWKSAETELVLHFAGATVADLNVYGSEMMRWMTADMLRKLFSPAMVRDTLRRSETIYAGIPVARLDEVTAGIEKRDKFTVFYGGRMGAVKRVDELTEIADLAFKFGRDMGMVVCTGTSNARIKDFAQTYPMVEMHTGTGQDEAWRLMKSCHVGFSWSKHEMIGSMFVEEMAAGLPLIASRHRWIESLLPPEYPFWASNSREAGAHLRLLYEAWLSDPAGYDEEMRHWTWYVREKWDSVRAAQQFRAVVERNAAEMAAPQTAGFERGAAASLRELIEQVIVEGMTYEALIEAVKNAAFKKQFLGHVLTTARSHRHVDVYRMMKHLGWEAVGSPAVVTRKEA